MPLDGLTLGFAAREMNAILAGGKVERVTQPEKDTVIVTLHAAGKNRKLLLCAAPAFARAHITEKDYINPPNAPMFCMLLRKYLGSARLESITQYAGDRVLILTFLCRNEMGDDVLRYLYLEIMGHHSNLTLVSGNTILDAIRHVNADMSRVRQALPGLPFIMPPLQDNRDPYDCPADELADAVRNTEGTLKKAIQTVLRGISARTADELCSRITGGSTDVPAAAFSDNDSQRLCHLLEKLKENPSPRVLCSPDGQPCDILPFAYLSLSPDLQKASASLSQAMDHVYGSRDRQDRIRQKSLSLRHTIRNALEREEKKLALQREEEAFGQKAESWRIWGELINSQLYLIPKGCDSVTLPDLYSENGGNITIPMDKTLTPTQNAQRYFKRYRKARVAAQTAGEQIRQTLRSIDILENARDDLDKSENEDDLNDIRLLLTEEGYIKKDRAGKKTGKRPTESKPLTFVSPGGHTVLVGKNSIQNERITFSSGPQDMWLHVKGIPGSHTVIRRDNKDITDADILFAARLAARYSSAKGDGVQVDYTLCRYVKKVSGAPRGFVIYTGEKTLYIRDKNNP